MLEDIGKSLSIIAKVFYVITHPKVIFDWLVGISYWLAVLVSISSLIFYVTTQSARSKRILNATIVAYILLKAIASVL